VRSLW